MRCCRDCVAGGLRPGADGARGASLRRRRRWKLRQAGRYAGAAVAQAGESKRSELSVRAASCCVVSDHGYASAGACVTLVSYRTTTHPLRCLVCCPGRRPSAAPRPCCYWASGSSAGRAFRAMCAPERNGTPSCLCRFVQLLPQVLPQAGRFDRLHTRDAMRLSWCFGLRALRAFRCHRRLLCSCLCYFGQVHACWALGPRRGRVPRVAEVLAGRRRGRQPPRLRRMAADVSALVFLVRPVAEVQSRYSCATCSHLIVVPAWCRCCTQGCGCRTRASHAGAGLPNAGSESHPASV